MKDKPASSNVQTERALWLRSAVDALRPDFEKAGLPLPDNIRFGFSTKGKGTKKTGECWHSPASVDGSFEIFIRADQDDPFQVLGILVRELVHAALPVDESQGRKFKNAALRIGLVGKMRDAVPGHLLEPRLQSLVEHLGPLPHAALDLAWVPVIREKKVPQRSAQAICIGVIEKDGYSDRCGYNVRLTTKWAREVGAWCPLHGAMTIKYPESPEPRADPEMAAPSASEPETPAADHVPYETEAQTT